MKPENRKFLDEHRHVHDTLVKAFYVKHLDGPTRSAMVRIMREEWQPRYSPDLWCGPCVADMVLSVYRHYDDWLVRNQEPTTEDDPLIKKKAEILETLMKPAEGEKPKPSAPIQTKANFPSHKNRRR